MAGDAFSVRKLASGAAVFSVFVVLAVALFLATGKGFWLFNFLYIGGAVGLGIGLFAALPRRSRHWGRRIGKVLVGAYMLGYLGFALRENMQIEGFFFYLIGGIWSGSVIHYLVAKVGGPLFFGRGWCGWACWTSALLDLLPAPRGKKVSVDPRWQSARYVHFGLSALLAVGVWLLTGSRPTGAAPVMWLVAGNLFYYGSAVLLARLLRDNRAFCKYLCPVPTLQKLPARLSLLKVSGDASRCTGCRTCSKACPMAVDIPAYVTNGLRVLSTECTHCMTCIDACPRGLLKSGIGLDSPAARLPRNVDVPA